MDSHQPALDVMIPRLTPYL